MIVVGGIFLVALLESRLERSSHLETVPPIWRDWFGDSAALRAVAAFTGGDIAAIAVGGTLFGVGWAIAGFCPRTSVGALAEGRIHAILASWVCSLMQRLMLKHTLFSPAQSLSLVIMAR